MVKNGTLHEGRKLEGLSLVGGRYTKGSHVANNNTEAGIGICLLGNYEGKESFPNARKQFIQKYLVALCRRHNLSETKVSYHKAMAKQNHPTKCPGSNIIRIFPEIINYIKEHLK
jgi:N-acetyl-anhydromuramyl-L-alanine amidase AmpD